MDADTVADNQLPGNTYVERINSNSPANVDDLDLQADTDASVAPYNHADRLLDKLADAGELKIDQAIQKSYGVPQSNGPVTGQGTSALLPSSWQIWIQKNASQLAVGIVVTVFVLILSGMVRIRA